jgi:hypothetical protein
VQAAERTEGPYATRGARSRILPTFWTPALDPGVRRGLDLEYALSEIVVDKRTRTGISCRTNK